LQMVNWFHYTSWLRIHILLTPIVSLMIRDKGGSVYHPGRAIADPFYFSTT